MEHTLAKQANDTLTKVNEIGAKIAQWQQDTIYAGEVREREISALKTDRSNLIKGAAGQWVQAAGAELDQLVNRRRDAMRTGHLNDQLNNPVAMDNAKARLGRIASEARNFEEFSAGYEQAQGADPYLVRAYQVHGPQYAGKWGGPAGAFLARLERDYENSFIPAADNETMLQQATDLREALRQAHSISRRLLHMEIAGQGAISQLAQHEAGGGGPEREIGALLGRLNEVFFPDSNMPKSNTLVFETPWGNRTARK